MYRTILVPLDGSQYAESILPHVEEMASLLGSTIILLQVIELPHLVGLPKGEIFEALPQTTPTEVSQQLAETRRYLDVVVKQLAEKGITAQAQVENGPVVTTILRVARQVDAGLIAMASHGRGGMTDVYYGSVAAGVLQRIDRPLLIVRAQG
ncbi:MAG: universal stress protein [Anaerolineae bacterium]|nr:universal stress protein [Anaerolineae bacterium]RIK16862.1 MAG: hypothetical protein DCC51_13060 [Anaerolineae bacterium]